MSQYACEPTANVQVHPEAQAPSKLQTFMVVAHSRRYHVLFARTWLRRCLLLLLCACALCLGADETLRAAAALVAHAAPLLLLHRVLAQKVREDGRDAAALVT